MLKRNSESGRSMVEMIGVLAIAGLLTAAAFILIRAGTNSQNISRTRDEIDVLAANTRALVAEGNNTCSLPKDFNWQTDGKTLAMALLKSDGTTAFGSGTYYSVTRSTDKTCNGDTTFRIHLMLSHDVCKTMGTLTYAGNGQAVCDTTDASKTGELKITYQK